MEEGPARPPRLRSSVMSKQQRPARPPAKAPPPGPLSREYKHAPSWRPCSQPGQGEAQPPSASSPGRRRMSLLFHCRLFPPPAATPFLPNKSFLLNIRVLKQWAEGSSERRLDPDSPSFRIQFPSSLGIPFSVSLSEERLMANVSENVFYSPVSVRLFSAGRLQF